MKWDVFRVITGRGLVDYLGQLVGTLSEVEDQARLMFDLDPNTEHFDFEEVTDDPRS